MNAPTGPTSSFRSPNADSESVATPPRSTSNDKTARKVLFIDHTAELSGGEIALFDLVRHLDPTRYQPHVLLFSDGPLRAKLDTAGIPTTVHPLSDRIIKTRKDRLGLATLSRAGDVCAVLKFAINLSRWIKSRGFHIVHCNSLKSDLIGGVAARLARVPVIWHVRDRIDADYLPDKVARLFRFLCRVLPHHVAANSRGTLSTLRLQHPERSATVVYSGVDLSTFTTPAPKAPTDAPVIGIVGRIARWKGQHVFLHAAASVLERFPNARFQIIGKALFQDADYEREIQALIEQLNLKDHVELLGFRNDVPALIGAMDLLVHASITGEPFGQVIVQGMALAKPVVATQGGGVPEIVEHGATGLLIPMADANAMSEAILKLLNGPAEARAIGDRARQRVLDHFTIQRTAEVVHRLYDRLVPTR